MSSILPRLDRELTGLGEWLEETARSHRDQPQYKYFTVPIYKACARKVGSVAATAISFLAADIIIHQFSPQAGCCLLCHTIRLIGDQSCSCSFHYYFLPTLCWFSLAIPIMYVKYKRFGWG